MAMRAGRCSANVPSHNVCTVRAVTVQRCRMTAMAKYNVQLLHVVILRKTVRYTLHIKRDSAIE